MKNIVRYVETEMNGLAAKKFNAVDSLVLSQLSYMHFEQMVPPLSHGSKAVRIGDLLRAEMFGSDFNMAFLSPVPSQKEATVYVSKTDVKLEQQFCAATFLLGDGSAYVVFRGTDETLVGWKEQFTRMSRNLGLAASANKSARLFSAFIPQNIAQLRTESSMSSTTTAPDSGRRIRAARNSRKSKAGSRKPYRSRR